MCIRDTAGSERGRRRAEERRQKATQHRRQDRPPYIKTLSILRYVEVICGCTATREWCIAYIFAHRDTSDARLRPSLPEVPVRTVGAFQWYQRPGSEFALPGRGLGVKIILQRVKARKRYSSEYNKISYLACSALRTGLIAKA